MKRQVMSLVLAFQVEVDLNAQQTLADALFAGVDKKVDITLRA